jgi:cyclopropane fatty-acyl-phospholipid synthase-like methyltransferase
MKNIYNNYYSQYYLKEARFDKSLYEKESKRLSVFMKNLLPDNKNVRILEIGCGVGFLLYFMQKQGYADLYGVDLSEEAVKLCRSHVTDKVLVGSAVDFLKLNIDRGETYDVIILFDTLEHFNKSDIIEIFNCSFSLLRSDGKLLIKVGNMSHLLGHQLFYHDFTHLSGFTEVSLRHLYFQAGFQKIKFIEQRPVLLRSKIKFFFGRCLQKLLYWIFQIQVPEVLSRKIIVIGTK